MVESPTFCQYPGDVPGFQQALITAWRAGVLSGHCVLDGLKAGCRQCFEEVLKGICGIGIIRATTGKATAQRCQGNGDLRAACKGVVLEGYHQGIRAAQELLVEAYRRLVRCAIYRCGLTDTANPSADDVFQDVFQGLHARLQKSAGIKAGHLGGYVWMTVVHACRRALGSDAVAVESVNEERAEKVWPQQPSNMRLDSSVVEAWEDLDHQLGRSGEGDLINRIILAHKCIEGQRTGKKYPIKKMLEAWRRTAKTADADLHRLSELASARTRSSAGEVISAIAELFNAGHEEPWKIPIIFGTSAGLSIDEIRRILGRLTSLTEGAVYARISHIYRALGSVRRESE